MQAKPADGLKSPRLLPPIVNGGESSTGSQSPMAGKPPGDRRGSRYHSGCKMKHSIYMDWASIRPEKKKPAEKETKQHRSRSLASFKDAEQQDVTKYLDRHKSFLENYVMENIPLQTVEQWLQRKMDEIEKLSPESPSEMKFKRHGEYTKKDMFLELLKMLNEEPTERQVVWALASGASAILDADAYRVFKIYPDQSDSLHYFATNQQSPYITPCSLVKVSTEYAPHVLSVVSSGACLRLSRYEYEGKFPAVPTYLFKAFGVNDIEASNNVMYMPILTKTGETSYVVEIWRDLQFLESDEEICASICVWGSLTLHYCSSVLNRKRESDMSEFLLDVAKAIFNEMVSLDMLIKRILEFAQKLVSADRASLFLVDYRNYELVSTVFDLKFEEGLDRDLEKKEIRMPINRGIAGYVAQSGETMNIPDAYADYRFNREVDEATGYKTVSILCMPIKVEGRIIGVVQMVNKRGLNTAFNHEDEVHFEIFSTFFGLALHHARLYDRIMRKEQKYRVALEVLSYHNTCRESDVEEMLNDNLEINVDLNDFYLDPFKFPEGIKCKSVVTMFNDLFDMSHFDLATMTRFILTVKKNYRRVPYHNFDHGWSVAHAMYVILKSDTQRRFDYKMRLALFVACLCHDLDHRGYTNKYMSETASPLAAMYTTSTLEHHHFNITVTILQQEGHNIFSHISNEDYKEILGLIRNCILATDLAAFFPNLDLYRLISAETSAQKFSWGITRHRDLAMAISMTAADLSASSKPWDIQNKTVKVIFEEFYEQGDKERAAGREPIPMMDRTKPEEQPASQVGFLSQICIPCYDMLYTILPNTKPMLTMAIKNLDRWQARANRVLRKNRRKKNLGVEEPEAVKITSDDDSSVGKAEVPDAFSWDEAEEIVIGKLEKVMKKDSGEISWIEEDDGLVAAKGVLKMGGERNKK